MFYTWVFSSLVSVADNTKGPSGKVYSIWLSLLQPMLIWVNMKPLRALVKKQQQLFIKLEF